MGFPEAVAGGERDGELASNLARRSMPLKHTESLTKFPRMIESSLVEDTTKPISIFRVKFRNPLLYRALQHLVPGCPLAACRSSPGTMANRPLAGFSTGPKEVSHTTVS